MFNNPLITNGSFTPDPFFVEGPRYPFPNGSYPFNASLVYSFPSGNLNWTTPQADMGMLAYDPSKTNMWVIGKTIDLLFQPSVFSYPQLCVYPISGQYGFLPRLLYYVLLVFSLIFREHDWLSTAALGTAMTYAATASVHAFVLLLRYSYRTPAWDNLDWIYPRADQLGDIDLQAIYPILVAGSIMLTPILSFSTTVRHHKAHSVIVSWGILLSCALIPTFVIVLKGIEPSIVLSQVSTCTLDIAKGCTFENLFTYHGGWSKSLYQTCNCSDTCGAFNIPNTPLRQNQGASAMLTSNTIDMLKNSNLVDETFLANSLFLICIIAQGILALIENQWDQIRVRNWVFCKIAGTTRKEQRAAFGSRFRYYVGKLIAGFYFLTTLAVALICPFVFVSSVIVNEIITWAFPVGEEMDAVGQWSTWVSVCFVLLALIIQKYHQAWLVSIKWICGKKNLQNEHKKASVKKNNGMKDTIKVGTLRAFRKLKEYSGEFKEWHNDTVGVSTREVDSSNEDQPLLEMPQFSRPVTPLAHTPLLPQGSSSFQPTPTTHSHSQSSMMQTSRHTTPDSLQTTIAPYGLIPDTSDTHLVSRPPFPRTAHSSSELSLLGSESPDLLAIQIHSNEPLMPPQAAWARPVLQPERYQVARKQLPGRKCT